MISKYRLELIEKKAKKDSSVIFRLTDVELVCYNTYLSQKINNGKRIFDDKKNYYRSLLNKIKNI